MLDKRRMQLDDFANCIHDSIVDSIAMVAITTAWLASAVSDHHVSDHEPHGWAVLPIAPCSARL
jgi:hypothetical protein